MNRDSQLSFNLSAADGSVAKIRERLTSTGKSSKDLFPQRESLQFPDLDVTPVSPHPHALSKAVQWSDMAAIQAQLQSQSQAIESLTQALRSMERERESQHHHLQAIQEELQKLHEHEDEWVRAVDRARGSPETDRRIELWKREVSRELSNLRGQIDRATSLTSQEESFSAKLRREEMEHLRREVDQLKQQLRRQEEDLFHQQFEGREMRRQYERNCKTLENLTDSYRTHSLDLTKTLSQYQDTQRDVRQLKMTVTELKEEVRGLILREIHSSPVFPVLSTCKTDQESAERPVSHHEERPASDSEEDFSSIPSLGDVSSDDLSWVAERDVGRHGKPHATENFQLTESEDGTAASGLEEDVEKDVDSIDLDNELETPSESFQDLSVSDL
ncbi:early endosome antigen 1-like [Arapaima gigas]